MKKSILIELFSKFNVKELREFGEFVNSPFFNKNESVIRLFDYLRKQHPDFEEAKIRKQYIYGCIFPNVEYSDGFMRTVMFNLTELAEKYIAYAKFREYEFAGNKYLLVGLNEKELDRHIEKKMKEISKEFEKVQALDPDYYINKYMIEWEYLFYLTRSYLDKMERLINRRDAEEIFNNLTYFYLFSVFKHYLYVLIIRNEYEIDFKTGLVENIIRYIKPEDFKDAPALTIYYNVLMLFLKESDIKSFCKVKEQINEFGGRLSKAGLMNIYTYVIHFCKKKIREGKTEFVRELLEIYKIMIEKEIYALHKEMSPKFYKNAVDTALKLKEFKWVKEFIEKYKDELPAEAQSDSYYYCTALYEFALKNYETALEMLRKVKYTELYQKLDLRCLIAELYYELNFDSLLLSHIDSFRHFLSNDNLVPHERKKYYSNFIKYVKCLSGLKDKDKKDGLENLKYEALKDSLLYNKEWVLEKIDELNG